MDEKEFSQIRQHLGKTQRHMAQLLGASPIAIQSFEAGMAEYSRTDGTLGAFSHGPERCSGQKGPTLVGHKELSCKGISGRASLLVSVRARCRKADRRR